MRHRGSTPHRVLALLSRSPLLAGRCFQWSPLVVPWHREPRRDDDGRGGQWTLCRDVPLDWPRVSSVRCCPSVVVLAGLGEPEEIPSGGGQWGPSRASGGRLHSPPCCRRKRGSRCPVRFVPPRTQTAPLKRHPDRHPDRQTRSWGTTKPLRSLNPLRSSIGDSRRRRQPPPPTRSLVEAHLNHHCQNPLRLAPPRYPDRQTSSGPRNKDILPDVCASATRPRCIWALDDDCLDATRVR